LRGRASISMFIVIIAVIDLLWVSLRSLSRFSKTSFRTTYLFLRVKGFEVNHTSERAEPDLVVAREGVEVLVEVKIASSGVVDDGIEQLFGYMKGTEWKHGALFIWDRTEKGAAYGRAKEIGTKTEYGRTVNIVYT